MFKRYCRFWLTTENQINDVTVREKFVQTLKPTFDRVEAHRIFTSLYGRYIVICNNLADIYDQTLQAQKRLVVQQLLEAATKRLLELQMRLKEIDLSEFIYYDDVIKELALTIQDVQILRPFYFPYERSGEVAEELKQRAIAEKMQEDMEKKMRLVMAINLIKAHERARKARLLERNLDKIPISLDEPMKYSFYHKPDQYLLIPIKRYDVQPNYCKVLRNVSNFSFYVPPGGEDRLKEEAKRVVKLKWDIIIGGERGPIQGLNPARKSEFDPLICATVPFVDDSTYIHFTVDVPKEESEVVIVYEKYGPAEITAAVKIQRYFLHYRIRKLVKMRRHRRRVYLGMIEEDIYDPAIREKVQTMRNKRRLQKELRDAEFIKAIEDTRARIIRLKGPFIMEDISEHIREWFRELYVKAHGFDDYPPVKKGGTILVIRGDSKTVEEYIKAKKQTEDDKKKEAEKKKKAKEKKKELKALAKAEKAARKAELKKEEKEKGKRHDFDRNSMSLKQLDETITEYELNWRNIDEVKNVYNKPYDELIALDIMCQLHQDLRIQVDELMRIEHELLRMALAKEMGEKFKRAKKRKEKKKKPKKATKPKRVATAIAFVEVYNKFVQMGIIQKYPKRRIDELIVDYNFAGEDDRMHGKFPSHFLGDLKQEIRTIMLGMGPLQFQKPRSVILAGPPMCGKKFLVEALCSETDAILFDLSPEKTSHIQNPKAFLSDVRQMALMLQPVVIYVKDVHRMFYKKVPAEDVKLNPGILSRYFFSKIIKPIKKTDKIVVIGTSNMPWKAKLAMKKCFDKALLLPPLDYAESSMVWRKGLLKKRFPDLESSPLAKMFPKGLSSGQIFSAINETLNVRRTMRTARERVKIEEFLECILTGDERHLPQSEKAKSFMKWYTSANKYKKMEKREILRLEKLAAKSKSKKNKKS